MDYVYRTYVSYVCGYDYVYGQNPLCYTKLKFKINVIKESDV
jgi:hypothetical protein